MQRDPNQDRRQLFDALWQQYQAVTPSAKRIHALLGDAQNQAIINDHIALRTFNIDKVKLDNLAAHFLRLGYVEGGEYHFETKKLYAKHFEHPDPTAPKVFISELLVNQCSEALQQRLHSLVDPLDDTIASHADFLYSGTHWQIDSKTYHALLQESEYAAWLAAWGYRANHFTVSINHLKHFNSVTEVNNLLKDKGFLINSAGGEIKGSPADMLEQSSTMADKAEVCFSDGVQTIPSCFYEFALRYPDSNGKLYNGFVAASADKIFESTDAKRH